MTFQVQIWRKHNKTNSCSLNQLRRSCWMQHKRIPPWNIPFFAANVSSFPSKTSTASLIRGKNSFSLKALNVGVRIERTFLQASSLASNRPLYAEWSIPCHHIGPVLKLVEFFDENVFQHFWISHSNHRTSSQVHFFTLPYFGRQRGQVVQGAGVVIRSSRPPPCH